MWSDISLWFWFAFPWWLTTLSIFSCAHWLHLFRSNVYSSALPSFCYLSSGHWAVRVLSGFWTQTPYQIHDLQIQGAAKVGLQLWVQETEFIRVLSFINYCPIFHMNICKPTFLKKDFIYLYFRKREGGIKRERNINVWLSLVHPLPGTWPETQACALTGNRTSDPLIRRLALNPLSHPSRGCKPTFAPAYIVSHSVGFLFTFLMALFAAQKFTLWSSPIHLFFFSFALVLLVI